MKGKSDYMKGKDIYRSLFNYGLIIFLIIFTLACNDPEQQLIGSWRMVEYKINGNDEPDEIKVEWVFNEDGLFRQTLSIPAEGSSDEALWSFDPAGMKITLDYINKRSEVTWNVVRLGDGILRVEYEIPGFFVEREFEKTDHQ
jgi:hypothetical protein